MLNNRMVDKMKRKYIAPETKWEYIGLDKDFATLPGGYGNGPSGSQLKDTNPGVSEGYVKEENAWEDAAGLAPTDLWDDEW